MPEAPWTRADVVRRYGLTGATADRLETYLETLIKWNARINLVGKSTLADAWRRHIADSVQLGRYIPESKQRIADLGSGAGLPGLILSIVLDRPVTLIEANAKKASFLTSVSRETSAPVTVLCRRIEDVEAGPFDVITSRALASLENLLSFSAPLNSGETIHIFPKGATAEQELTESAKNRILTHRIFPSDTDENGKIIIIDRVEDRHD